MQAIRRAIFIDGSNLYAAAKNLGFDIDYGKLRYFFEAGSWLVRAYYYTAIADDQEYSPVRPLADWLDYNGFTLVSKPAKEFVDHAGRRRIRGNMDVEIAVDALNLAPHIDHMILMSGDGDFRRLIEAMQAKGVKVTVVSTIRTSPPMAADEVRRQADEFLDLLDIAPEIERR
ncbi:MAG: NYN domain-containing protein, partial [Alphaproteobacteria bacterium]